MEDVIKQSPKVLAYRSRSRSVSSLRKMEPWIEPAMCETSQVVRMGKQMDKQLDMTVSL